MWNENHYITSIESVVKFLHGTYNGGCLCSSLCLAWSALASVVTIKEFAKLSDHPSLVKYLKEIFNRHPPLPSYMHKWDINLVLTYYDRIGYIEELECKYLVKKTVMLFMILGARRKHALSKIYVGNIIFKDDKVILLPNKTLKHSKPTIPLQPLIYNVYKENIKLCLVKSLLSYLERPKLLANDDVREIVISYGKPHRPLGSDTLSRWIKDELELSGTDANVFAAHSCRSASVSKAKVNKIGINEIMKRGCWKNESAFKIF